MCVYEFLCYFPNKYLTYKGIEMTFLTNPCLDMIQDKHSRQDRTGQTATCTGKTRTCPHLRGRNKVQAAVVLLSSFIRVYLYSYFIYRLIDQ